MSDQLPATAIGTGPEGLGPGILSAPHSPVPDVEMEPFLYGLWINVLIFFLLVGSYELCSRVLPSVYSPKDNNHKYHGGVGFGGGGIWSCLPFSWVPAVARASWSQVLDAAGLDAYMFLRYIRMCGIITAVTGFWGALILFPTYAAAGEGETGWYYLSMANVAPASWRLWISAVFLWFATFFVFYLMSEEYRHYAQCRADFLTRLDRRRVRADVASSDAPSDASSQDRYTLTVDCIPHHLRSDQALFQYFDSLFPGRVHSATVVLNMPDLEALCVRRQRVVRRLEKSVAYHESTGRRPRHVVGRKRLRCCGVEFLPCGGSFSFGRKNYIEDYEKRLPQRGEMVDSINYYNNDLGAMNEKIAMLQREKLQVAAAGNDGVSATARLASTLEQFGQESLLGFQATNITYCAFIVRVIMGFIFGGLSLLDRTLDVVVDSVEKNAMSSCGFVTFKDLTTTTCAASTRVAFADGAGGVLNLSPAPEPRDILWANAHVDHDILKGRELTANLLLIFGVVFWSVPVASIQSLPNLRQISEDLGVQWILTFRGGVVEGYLPVLALLGLIMLLPPIFETIAVSYENRKTQSDIQNSILSRFFYYQLATVFVTVTAASIWDSLGEILEQSSEVLKKLGSTIPNVVGYFIALLITKILAGLPLVMLRLGALSRMVFIKICFREKYMSQREVNSVYKRQALCYGYEYPTQLLVIVICFTYTSISPIILPVGAVYFLFAFFVYKKQCLLIYSPTFEAGGSMFSNVCHNTLIGLVCGQVTLIGYMLVRQGFYQMIVLLPLPLITIRMLKVFDTVYALPARLLPLERARQLDFTNADGEKTNYPRVMNFDRDTYRQPSLTVGVVEPIPYRDGSTSVFSDVSSQATSSLDTVPLREGDSTKFV